MAQGAQQSFAAWGLYLTENHIGFYCASKTGKLKEVERRLLIEIVTVTQVSKTRSMNVFPDSIAIETAGGGRVRKVARLTWRQ